MKPRRWWIGCAVTAAWPLAGWAECTIAEASLAQDPVEVGYCESDAVFVGKVASRMETARAYRDEGSEVTKHYLVESSTVEVSESFKGKPPVRVTLSANLYDKKSAFSFKLGEEYVVFAKRLGSNEYAAASAACSVQPTLLKVDAGAVLKQLEQHAGGRTKIDCANIRPKSQK
jgi:hypothetical protein